MRRLTTNWFIAAAVLAAAAGIASAQVLIAEIPFPFRVGSALLAPGTYRVVTNVAGMSAPIIRLANQDNLKSSALVMAVIEDPAKASVAEKTPKLAFDCIDARCTLAKVWDGTDRSAMALRDRARGNKETASLSVVTLKAVRAE